MKARPDQAARDYDARDLAWQEHAACRGADPTLFDAVTLGAAAPALAYCRECPVTAACTHLVVRGAGRDWHNGTDGVYGGVVYNNGRAVTDSRCGTTGGHWDHRRRNEAPCEPCRDAQRQVYASRNRRPQ